jgi:peptidoglycan/LPS O-acetylase OafA/YrhL
MAQKDPAQQFSIGYFPGLDLLRFICATGVIFHHTAHIFSERGLIPAEIHLHQYSGSFFVDVFFIISGFLIGAILKKEIEHNRFDLKKFYLRRIIRIWPLYFLIVLLLIIIVPMVKGVSTGLLKTNLLYALSFTVNFQLLLNESIKTYAVIWTVCIEEHIYLLLPLLLLLFRKKTNWVAIFLVLFGISSWVFFWTWYKSGGPSPYFISTCYFYYFGLGFLLSALPHVFSENKLKPLFSPVVQVIMYGLTLVFALNYLPDIFYSSPLWLVMCGLHGTYLVAAACREDFIFKVKPNLSRYAGNISYAMYMVHVAVINVYINILLKKRTPPDVADILLWCPLVVLFFTILVSSVLYYLYERPILKLKNKYTTIANR